ncbi:MAG: DUF4329 domain-containing protein [Isosphaeraceae bacterium]
MRHAKLPLNPDAVKAADEALYKNHPELGRRKLTMAPTQAEGVLRKEWMDAYIAAGGAVEGLSPAAPVAPTTPCSAPPATTPPAVNEKGRRKFSTAEEAAVDAMQSVNAQSVKEGREYGGWVYKNSDGTYSYDPPVKGTKDGLSNMPSKGPDDVVWYHTHGSNDPGYENENFSDDTGDKGYSKANKADGYVATPSGAIKKYDPATDKVTTLPETAPH